MKGKAQLDYCGKYTECVSNYTYVQLFPCSSHICNQLKKRRDDGNYGILKRGTKRKQTRNKYMYAFFFFGLAKNSCRLLVIIVTCHKTYIKHHMTRK